LLFLESLLELKVQDHKEKVSKLPRNLKENARLTVKLFFIKRSDESTSHRRFPVMNLKKMAFSGSSPKGKRHLLPLALEKVRKSPFLLETGITA